MNPEINAIVKDMRQRSKGNPAAASDIQNYMSAQMARLLALLAEESEKQSNKTSEQNEKMIRFTKSIRALTYALLFFGIVQIIMMIVKP